MSSQFNLSGQPLYRFRTSWNSGEFIGFLILWAVIIIVTLGICAVFAPYAIMKKLLDGTQVYDKDNQTVGVLQVNASAGDNAGSMILWIVLHVFTGGLASIIYTPIAYHRVMNNTFVVEQSAQQQFVQ